jgi:hypothetical protein
MWCDEDGIGHPQLSVNCFAILRRCQHTYYTVSNGSMTDERSI